MKKSVFLTGIIFILTSMIPYFTFAQSGYEVKGSVYDQLGPVAGATILEKGTTTGTSTGIDGDYILYVSGPTATVEISCIGYATQTFTASQVPATVTLGEDTQFLDEVVVIGYGTMKKSDLTGSVASVSSKALEKFRTGSVLEALGGQVAGVNQKVGFFLTH